MKYVDIELLTKEINNLYDKWCGSATGLEVAEEGASISTAESIFEEVRKIIVSLQQEQKDNKPSLLKSLKEYLEKTPKKQLDADWEKLKVWNEVGPDVETYCKAQREQQEVDLEKFTEKMDDWKARYNHPDNIPIKATMAFTARMFYMYPKAAREWYENLPKATFD